MHKLIKAISLIVVAAPLVSFSEQVTAATAAQTASCQTVEIAGHSYFFPVGKDEFLATSFDDAEELGSAAEVGLPHHFWMAVYGSVREVRGWLALDSVVLTPTYLAEPNDIFQWRDNSLSAQPPVRGPVELEEVRTGYKIWRSHDPEIKPPLRYATFDSNPNLYVEAYFDALDDPDESLDLIWNDNGILHRINLPGDWVGDAPAVASAYEAIIERDCRVPDSGASSPS